MQSKKKSKNKCKRIKVRKNADGSLNVQDMEHNRKCEQKNMLKDNLWMKDILNIKKPKDYNKTLKLLVKKRIKTLKNKNKNKKTKKGGINLSGCPEGKIRAFGSHCGIFRTPLGCCIDNREEKLKKMSSFMNNIFGGKKVKIY